MDEIKSRLAVAKSELPPCCLRIHPVDNSLIILGTYKLENGGTRNGSLDFYKYDQDSEKDEGEKLILLKRYATESAILDLKFSPFDDSILVSAHSTGNIQIWKFSAEDTSLRMEKSFQVSDDSDVLITSIFFSPIEKNLLLATTTSGSSAIVNLQDFSVQWLDTAHDLECWTGYFGELGELQNVVFTGGDDSKLIAHDLRTKEAIWQTGHRHHEAGVVSILAPGQTWNTQNPHQLWTGSYDDHLKILDLRVLDRAKPSLITGYIPKVLQSENLGGGVWRLIPSPLRNDSRILTCCMYDGARIVSMEEKNKEEFVVSKYFKRDHESMCYGGDWASSGKFAVTCSFYDNVVQVWSPDAGDKNTASS